MEKMICLLYVLYALYWNHKNSITPIDNCEGNTGGGHYDLVPELQFLLYDPLLCFEEIQDAKQKNVQQY